MCQIKRVWLPTCIAFALFLGVAFPAASSSIIPPRDFGELVRISDLVVVAKAGGGSGYKKGELIMTGTMFTIIDVVKGSISIGSDIRVETFGGIYGDRGLAIGGSPQFKDGDVYLLSLSEFNGEWTLRFMSYGVLVQRRMVTGQQVFAHLEEAHELNVIVPDGRVIEPITTYLSSTIVPYLQQVVSGTRTWSRESAGEVANAGHDGALKLNDILGLDAAPPGCVYMEYSGTKIRWRRFEQSLNVGVKVINGAPANVVTAVQNSVTAWKAVPGIDMGTLSYGGNNPIQAGCSVFDSPNLNSIPTGDSHIYLDDPCGEVADLVGCSGILAVAGPAFNLATHLKNGENWYEALIGVMVVNNGTPGCITPTQYEQTITHELGHILGFGHHTGATANMNASCCSPITSLDESCAFYAYGTGAGNPVPVITSLNPNNANQGTNNLAVQINGTDFVTGGTFGISGSGISVNSSSFVNSTTLSMNISIAPGATAGARNVTYTNPAPGGGISNAAIFTVNQPPNPVPTLSSVSPNTGQQSSSVPVTLTGTNFMAGATVAVSGGGITVSSVSVVNATTITALFTISGAAAVGDRDVTVTNIAPGGGTSGAQTFTVTIALNPVPVLESVTPNSGNQGAAVNVTLVGSNFVFFSSVAVSGTGVTVSNVTFINSTTMTALFTISADASLGARNVRVGTTGPGGGVSDAVTFTITQPPNPVPVLSSITPNTGTQSSAVNVTLTGSNFAPGATVQVSGSGITVTNVSVTNSTTMSALFTIMGGADLGARNVTVTNPAPGGGVSGAQTFTVTMAPNPVPTLTQVTPNNGVQGSTVNVSLLGTGFMSGSTVDVSGAGITVSNVVVVNTTLITAQIAISIGAAIGSRNVTISNPAPGGGTSNFQSFTITELFVNKQPTMNPIGDVSFLHTAAPQVVNLSGISAGAGENQNLTVTAVAANTQLIQSLSVQYVSPQATGTLVFQNDRRMVGTTTISVKVKDNGGTANGGVDSLIRVFTVNVNLDTNLEPDLSELPTDYELLQNYPNPFNPSTIIPFHLPGRAFVTMGVYDVTGRLKTTLLHQEMGAGRHEVSLDASNFGSGLYLVRMTSEFGIKSVMIMLVK